MTTSPQCQVLLSLAHLLQQHSLSYDDEKDLLLNVSVKSATQISNQYKGGINSPSNAPEGEVHLILTGSPRPTFAETNAWLLDSSPKKSPRKNSSETCDERADSNLSTESLRGSYSILDNSMDIHPDNNDDHDDDSDVSMANNDEEEAEEGRGEGGESGAQLLQEYINDCARNESNSSTRNANLSNLSGSPTRSGGSVLSRYRERKNSEASAMSATSDIDAAVKAATDSIEKTNSVAGGPMVGHAVVDAVNQSKGVGLQSSRAKLLQGTIDRPLWDQRRWTDGECLFSELIEKVGLESFENTANVGCSGAVGNSADVAAGGVVSRPITGADIIVPEQPTNLGEGLAKSSNLAANLITVPATKINEGEEQQQGLEESTIDEIARGILRCLKRKKSPPASKLVLVLPPLSNSEKEEQRRQVASARLMAAFQKLEQYNDMIGAPKLMSDAEYEIANVVSA